LEVDMHRFRPLPAITLLAASLTLAAMALWPASASAGFYDITVCRGNPSGSSLAFGAFTTRGMTRARKCQRDDAGPNGIVAASVRRPGRVPFRARSIFAVNVPRQTVMS
jgi:hypothetical protein